MQKEVVMSNIIRGGIAGGLATVGMTAAMMLMHRGLPARQRYCLPPEQIVAELLERAKLEHPPTHHQFEWLSMLAHHGYGASMGAAYGAFQGPHHTLSPSPVVRGMGFGLVVWAISYCGWLPAFGMDASATREPAPRNALTVVSHLVWGGITGWLTGAASPTRAQRHQPVAGNLAEARSVFLTHR